MRESFSAKAPPGNRQNPGVDAGRNLRILIVSHFFPPLNSIGSFRPYSWARTWSDLGHEVHVLTTGKHGFDGALDLECDLGGIHLHTVRYLPGRHKGLVQASRGTFRTTRWERLKSATRRIRLGLAMFADLRMLALRPLIKKGCELCRERRFDFVISCYQPEVVHFVAHSLSRRFGVPWIADYRDLWFRDVSGHAFRAILLIASIFERRTVRTAALVSTVSVGLAKELGRYLGREVHVCYNGYLATSRPDIDEPVWCDEKLHLVYTGRFYPRKRDPETFFAALRTAMEKTPGVSERIVVDLYGYCDPWVASLIERYRVADCVRVHGPVPNRLSLAAQRQATVLLFFDWLEKNTEGVLTGKLFEYIAASRPIMAIGAYRHTEAAEIIARCRSGVVLADNSEIVAYLLGLLRAIPSIEPEPEAIVFFSREHQAQLLLDKIRRVLRAPASEPACDGSRAPSQ